MASLVVVAIALLSSILCASAASQITEFGYSYKEWVEPICREMSKGADKARGKVRDVRFYPSARASTALKGVGKALSKGFLQLNAVESPPEERAQLHEWVLFVKRTAQRYSDAGIALGQGHAARARVLLTTIEVPSTVEATEDAQGFAYCKFDPQRWLVLFRVPAR